MMVVQLSQELHAALNHAYGRAFTDLWERGDKLDINMTYAGGKPIDIWTRLFGEPTGMIIFHMIKSLGY
jgi:hypothetical protein